MIQIVNGKMLFEHNYNEVLHNNLFIWILLIFFVFVNISRGSVLLNFSWFRV